MNFNYNDGGRNKYFKGHAGDCVVRALAILLDEDYKKTYNFAFNLVGTTRNGVSDIHAVYSKKDLIYESISGYAGDYPFDDVEFNFIAQYGNHVHAIIDKTINDTHEKNSIEQMEGVWVEKKNEEEVLKILYPNEYYEDAKVDEHGLTWVS